MSWTVARLLLALVLVSVARVSCHRTRRSAKADSAQPHALHAFYKPMHPVYSGDYGQASVANLTKFRRSLLREVLGNAPQGYSKQGWSRYDLYPSDVVHCPPGRRAVKLHAGPCKLGARHALSHQEKFELDEWYACPCPPPLESHLMSCTWSLWGLGPSGIPPWPTSVPGASGALVGQ